MSQEHKSLEWELFYNDHKLTSLTGFNCILFSGKGEGKRSFRACQYKLVLWRGKIPKTSPRYGWAMPKNPGVLSSTGTPINWRPWRKNCRKMTKNVRIACLAWKYGHKWKSPTGTQGKNVWVRKKDLERSSKGFYWKSHLEWCFGAARTHHPLLTTVLCRRDPTPPICAVLIS